MMFSEFWLLGDSLIRVAEITHRGRIQAVSCQIEEMRSPAKGIPEAMRSVRVRLAQDGFFATGPPRYGRILKFDDTQMRK